MRRAGSDLSVFVSALQMSHVCLVPNSAPAATWAGSPQGHCGVQKIPVFIHSSLRPSSGPYPTAPSLSCIEVPSRRKTGSCWKGFIGGHKDAQRAAVPLLQRQLRELGLFSLEKRRLQGDFIAAFQDLKGAYKQEGSQLFERVDNSRTRGNGLKLKEGRFRLDIRGKSFTRRVVTCWNGLPREAVDAPSREVCEARLNGALGSLV